jgi:ribonucleoside-diphosphate reductase alpha chain
MIYDDLSQERKILQKNGLLPDFYTTGGYQLLKANYLWADSPLEQYQAIAKSAALYVDGIMPLPVGCSYSTWYEAFFDLLWMGWLSPSSPVLSNMGNPDRGMPVSCSGQYIADNVDSFYTNLHESAVLSKHGFGTSAYVGDIRPRGTPMMKGTGKASGVMPVIDMFAQMAGDISQGSNRRGSIALYMEIDHDDFYEVLNKLEHNPKKYNIGWNITDAFIEKLNNGDEDSINRYQETLRVKMVTGKGYYFFVDKVNRIKPTMWQNNNNCVVKASNLCSEISLYSNTEESFTCVLSSMNLAKWDEWKNTPAIYIATVFLDCVASEFIKQAKAKNILAKAVRFTERNRALGLGLLGFASYLSKNMIPFEDFRAHLINIEIAKSLKENSHKASEDMSVYLGEPEICVGFGRRNTHTMALAPTKSTALLMGGASESISPHIGMTYTQVTPAGEVERINPELVELMKSKNIFSKKHLQEVIEKKGSVQEVSWLTDEESVRQPFANFFKNGAIVFKRTSEVQSGNPPQPTAILNIPRFVQIIERHEFFPLFMGGRPCV